MILSYLSQIQLVEWLLLLVLISIIVIFFRGRRLTKVLSKEAPLMFKQVVRESPFEYVEGYSQVELSSYQKCPLINGRCREEKCYAFVEKDNNFYCKQFMLEFINYEAKK